MNQHSNKSMSKSIEIPDCNYTKEAILIRPSSETPNHILHLSNLDDQPFLRFPIRYLYLFKKSTCVESLKLSLSRILVDYYPLAGRLRASKEEKIEVDCNGKGAVFAEGFTNLSAAEFLEGSRRPNRSWRKLLYPIQAPCFLAVPPLVIHVIHLNCGGMILITSINHCLCDGIGTSQFLSAWAQITKSPNSNLLLIPYHSRHLLNPRSPPRTAYPHPLFNSASTLDLTRHVQSQPLTPISVTFTSSQILALKRQCTPSFKCSSFEVLSSHVWCAWVKSLSLPSSLNVKLLFSVNARRKLNPELPKGYYGNGFVLGCAESSVEKLVGSNVGYGVGLVQKAKERVEDEYVRGVVDSLEERKVRPDLSASLVISQWSKMGLEDVDFGEGKAVHMGPVASEIYCLLLPVIGDVHGFTVLVSVPEEVADRFEFLLKEGGEEDDGLNGCWAG